MPTITYREVREWPGEKTATYRRTRAPFKAHATKLWDLLDRELQKINAQLREATRDVTQEEFEKVRAAILDAFAADASSWDSMARAAIEALGKKVEGA